MFYSPISYLVLLIPCLQLVLDVLQLVLEPLPGVQPLGLGQARQLAVRLAHLKQLGVAAGEFGGQIAVFLLNLKKERLFFYCLTKKVCIFSLTLT